MIISSMVSEMVWAIFILVASKLRYEHIFWE